MRGEVSVANGDGFLAQPPVDLGKLIHVVREEDEALAYLAEGFPAALAPVFLGEVVALAQNGGRLQHRAELR